MLARLSLAIVVFIVLGIQHIAGASPITYDFTGTFVPYANTNVNGSNQIMRILYHQRGSDSGQ